REQLHKINRYEYKGEYHAFSQDNIEKAIRDIDVPLTDGLIQSNEKIYDLLMLGKSYEEFTPDGNRRSFNIHYIDWKHPENNVYHVTYEFQVEHENSSDYIYLDIVLLINGIPFGVFEIKRHTVLVIISFIK